MLQIKYTILNIFKYLSLILGAFVALFPIIVVFNSSFKTREEFNSSGPLALPENFFNFDNYIVAFKDGKMLLAFANTFFILAISLTGAIILSSLVAYVLNRFDFKLKPVILGAFLFATLIPGVTTQVATFQIVEALGLYNTRMASIILFMGTDIISVYIFIQFISDISVSLDESAMLDGASYFTIYRKIILPLLKPAISTVVIIKGIQIYNDFYTPFLYMPSPKLQVISTALFKFQGPASSQWELICAGIIIVIIPTVIIFLFLQKYIYNGFTQGSVK
ncbi:carbohydrate ABC transporter permease [Clostridium grantii]|uniref:Multiple sugar transport system permease protein n=1 Tax=Clostridium grantii DSM 8605 TaxID=1121316 RepID=A0A1M5UBH1_9CLOT|nr:carbohydrate ABC transporter permease [Clostridium grantii]SHH60261.1 multiple sugar transport system permease protein [Clostridium grantii DSM 8605]